MTGFRFIFPDNDEGFEVVEETTQSPNKLDDEDKETASNDDDEVIWETEED